MYNACPLGMGILTDAGERIATPACELVRNDKLGRYQHRTGR